MGSLGRAEGCAVPDTDAAAAAEAAATEEEALTRLLNHRLVKDDEDETGRIMGRRGGVLDRDEDLAESLRKGVVLEPPPAAVGAGFVVVVSAMRRAANSADPNFQMAKLPLVEMKLSLCGAATRFAIVLDAGPGAGAIWSGSGCRFCEMQNLSK